MAKESTLQQSFSNSKYEALRSMSAQRGTKIYSGTGSNTGLELIALSVRETPTTFTTLVMKGDGDELAYSDLFVGGTVNLQQGDLIRPPLGYIITEFELASGSVIGT